MSNDVGYWLSPQGEVVETQIGRHMENGFELCKKYYAEETMYEINNTGTYMFKAKLDAVYFLEEKNWIRYQGWCDVEWIIRNTHRPTKRQIEKMYELTGYFYEH